MPPPTCQKYYPAFDYLRAACATTVMLYHIKALTWSQSGNLAVQVFFALSGWLIGGILINTKPNELYRFYFNRAVRIWIPYYIALILVLILSIYRDPITEKWWEIVIYKVTFVYNIYGTPQLANFASQMPLDATFNHAWSVNAEEQFYLVAPILLVLGARHFGSSLITWGIISILGLAYNLYPAIILGVFFSILTNTRPATKERQTKYPTLLILILTIPFLTWEKTYALAAPIFAILLVSLLAIPGPQNNLGKLLGGMSYPLYLNHWIGVYAANYLLPSMRHTLTNVALSSIINICIAMAMYVFIEKRMLEARNHYFTNLRGKTITAVAYILLITGICIGQMPG